MKTWVVIAGRDGSTNFWAWGELSDSPGFVNIYYTLPDGVTMYSPRNINEHGLPNLNDGLVFAAPVPTSTEVTREGLSLQLPAEVMEVKPVTHSIDASFPDGVGEVAGADPVAETPPEVTP